MAYRYETIPELPKMPLRQHIVVLSGAGISVESGLATFRGDDGSLVHLARAGTAGHGNKRLIAVFWEDAGGKVWRLQAATSAELC